MSISCPPRPKRTGRPRDTSLKSWNKHSKLEKEKGRGNDEKLAKNKTDECAYVTGKTTRLSDLMQVT